MTKSQFTKGQMVGMLREADQSSVATVAKERGVSEQTLCIGRKRFAGFAPKMGGI